MKCLAVDVGYKHFGLALADGPLATPLPSYSHHSLTDSEAYLLQLAKTHHATTIILGLPDGKVAELVHDLQAHLAQHQDYSIILHPEDFSTQDAVSKLREIGAKRGKLQNDHSYAACLILEDYLESLL